MDFALPFSTSTVTIEVVDVNDHAPVFDFPDNTSSYVQVIPENSPITTVITLSASDLDSGSNGEVFFDSG